MKLIGELADALTLSSRTTTYFRQQNYNMALQNMQVLSEHLINLIELLLQENVLLQQYGYEVGSDDITSILSGIVTAEENGDYILLADLLEMQLTPFLLEIQEVLVSNVELPMEEAAWKQNLSGLKKRNVNLAEKVENCRPEGNCFAEMTSSGLWTLHMTDKSGSYYFHANTNPRVEADIFAKEYYCLGCDHYIVFGLGLGYHIKAMADMDNGIYIDVIEPDLEIIRLANLYTDMSWLYENPRICLLHDEDYTKWKNIKKDNVQLVIHYPSLRHILIPEIKLQIENFFVRDSSRRNYSIQFENNFRDNILHCDGYVDELRADFEGKNAVIVAGGPSLDKNIELLLNKPENTLVIAVGAVFHKLMAMQVVPDYVIFLDAQPSLYSQMKGLEMSKVPILCASTACKQIAAEYKGRKYLICQKGYNRAEEYAREREYQVYETGGSVSTIALDVCLRLGCRRIAYIGLDLAFTNNQGHAANAGEVMVSEKEKTVMVPSVNGDRIASRKLFIIYKEWIERRVAREDAKGKVIDATEGGALKKGLKIQTLSEVLAEWQNALD